MTRIWLARAAALLLLAGAVQPFYFRFLGTGVDAFGRYASSLPYQKTPGLQDFMNGVRGRTHDGDRIAIVVPMQRWDGGYAYAFTRSTYLLAGRTTVPVVGPHDEALRPTGVDCIAAWRTVPHVRGFHPVWHDANGVLLRRGR